MARRAKLRRKNGSRQRGCLGKHDQAQQNMTTEYKPATQRSGGLYAMVGFLVLLLAFVAVTFFLITKQSRNEQVWIRLSTDLQVHSHCNGEFARGADGTVELVASGYFDQRFWERRIAYPAYVKALVKAGYDGYINWEFCHPAKTVGQFAGIDYVHDQTAMAIEYLQGLRAEAMARQDPSAHQPRSSE